VQSDYLKTSYEQFVAQATKVGELYAGMAQEFYKQFETTMGKTVAKYGLLHKTYSKKLAPASAAEIESPRESHRAFVVRPSLSVIENWAASRS